MIYCPGCGRDVPLIARKLGHIYTMEIIFFYRCTQCGITYRKTQRGEDKPITAITKEAVIKLPDGAEIFPAGRKLLGGA